VPFLPVGGQAVLEGVMMRSPSKVAVTVRRGDGSLATMERPFSSLTRRYRILGIPVLRGAVSLFETLYLGISALNFSAEEATKDGAPAPGEKSSSLPGAAQMGSGSCCSWCSRPASPPGSASPTASPSGWWTACSGCWRS